MVTAPTFFSGPSHGSSEARLRRYSKAEELLVRSAQHSLAETSARELQIRTLVEAHASMELMAADGRQRIEAIKKLISEGISEGNELADLKQQRWREERQLEHFKEQARCLSEHISSLKERERSTGHHCTTPPPPHHSPSRTELNLLRFFETRTSPRIATLKGSLPLTSRRTQSIMGLKETVRSSTKRTLSRPLSFDSKRPMTPSFPSMLHSPAFCCITNQEQEQDDPTIKPASAECHGFALIYYPSYDMPNTEMLESSATRFIMPDYVLPLLAKLDKYGEGPFALRPLSSFSLPSAVDSTDSDDFSPPSGGYASHGSMKKLRRRISQAFLPPKSVTETLSTPRRLRVAASSIFR